MSRFRRLQRAALLTGIALTPLALTPLALIPLALPLSLVTAPIAPAHAQASVSVEFRTALAPHGDWHQHRRWGNVWVPARVERGWRPYTVGRWVYSDDYGWYWNSDEEEAGWGLVVYHYGRWIDDPDLGWCWIPGEQWGPSWVSWRRGQGHAGWAPLPPDELVTEYRDRPDYWVFVRTRDLVAPRVSEVILPPRERDLYIRETVVVNRTVVLSDQHFAVAPGIEPSYVAAAYGRPIPAYEVRPHVLAGTAGIRGAVTLQPDDLRDRTRTRRITTEVVSQRSATTIEPARDVPPPRALGADERGRLGDRPPRAARNAGMGSPQSPGAPGSTTGSDAPPPRTTGTGDRQRPNETDRPGAPGQAGRTDRGGPDARDSRTQRGAAPPDEPSRQGARKNQDRLDQKGRSNQTQGAGSPEDARRPANKNAGDRQNQERGRMGGRDQTPGASPQNSRQSTTERDRGGASRSQRGDVRQAPPQTSGAAPNAPASRERNRTDGPRGERGGALQDRTPRASGAPEPRGNLRGGELRGERGSPERRPQNRSLDTRSPSTTGAGAGAGVAEPRGGRDSHPAERGPGGPAAGPAPDRGGARERPRGGPATTGAGPARGGGELRGGAAPQGMGGGGGAPRGPAGPGGGGRGPGGER